jgi:hypothetical protein
MKKLSIFSLIILCIIIFTGCSGKNSSKKEIQNASDTVASHDTGYTGIKKYTTPSGKYLVKEVTFKNGVREGLMKQYYQTGELRQTFIYRNNLREDSSIFYFPGGQIFRTTPYKRDTIDGIQKQFYSTGQLKAKIGFSKGLRTMFFEEYTPQGKLVGGYPTVIINVKDNYKTNGQYNIMLSLSDKSENVKFYRGDFSDGHFDTAHCKLIKTIKGVGYLDLKKSNSGKSSNVDIMAAILTTFNNNYLVRKKIDLPYKDLN